MIWLFLSCLEGPPSALDKRFCEARCEAAGATACTKERYYAVPKAQTTVDNGDILCTCCFPQGTAQPSQDPATLECE